MTQRKPAGVPPATWAERQIVDAMARGEFGTSDHAGRPLDLSDARDPDWWIRRKLRDEEFVVVPPALQLRRDRDELLADLERLPSEQHVREAVDRLNDRIRYANSHVIPGPPSTLMPLDPEAVVARWAAGRHEGQLPTT